MDRSTGRTVFIYDAKGDNKQLGGLINTHGITNKNFSRDAGSLEILLVFDSPYTLKLAGGDIVPKDGAELQPGNYYVDGSFAVNNEPCILRVRPFATASGDAAVMTAVRNRDAVSGWHRGGSHLPSSIRSLLGGK